MNLIKLNDSLQQAYLSYLNDYITIERFAADHHITVKEAEVIIIAGRAIHEQRAIDMG